MVIKKYRIEYKFTTSKEIHYYVGLKKDVLSEIPHLDKDVEWMKIRRIV